MYWNMYNKYLYKSNHSSVYSETKKLFYWVFKYCVYKNCYGWHLVRSVLIFHSQLTFRTAISLNYSSIFGINFYDGCEFDYI